MPSINISLNDDQYRVLSEEYKKMSIEWLHAHAASIPPSFEQWLGTHLMTSVASVASPEREVVELRIFNAIETLITRLQAHGFILARPSSEEDSVSQSAAALAQTIATDLALAHARTKRIQELLEYYSKNPKEIADLGRVSLTKRAYAALHESFRELLDRTEKAKDHLGEDKAVGRIEGAVAMLVGVHAMSRHAATKKTEAFKATLRDRKK